MGNLSDKNREKTLFKIHERAQMRAKKKLRQAKFIQMIFIPLNHKQRAQKLQRLLSSHAMFVSKSLILLSKNQIKNYDFSPPQVAKMSVTNAKISVTKFASKCHKL